MAGCLALPAHEQDSRRIVGEMGELSDFGTVGSAVRIMEATWGSRDKFNGKADIASFLTVSGDPALLI